MSESTPWGIHSIGNMVAPKSAMAGSPDGRWVRAVPEPYYVLGLRERLRAAWWVMTHKAFAVTWPKPGDIERALGSAATPEEEPRSVKLLRGPLSKRATSAEFNEWQAREVVEFIDRLRATPSNKDQMK